MLVLYLLLIPSNIWSLTVIQYLLSIETMSECMTQAYVRIYMNGSFQTYMLLLWKKGGHLSLISLHTTNNKINICCHAAVFVEIGCQKGFRINLHWFMNAKKHKYLNDFSPNHFIMSSCTHKVLYCPTLLHHTLTPIYIYHLLSTMYKLWTTKHPPYYKYQLQ